MPLTEQSTRLPRKPSDMIIRRPTSVKTRRLDHYWSGYVSRKNTPEFVVCQLAYSARNTSNGHASLGLGPPRPSRHRPARREQELEERGRARTGSSKRGLDGWIGSTSVESVPDASWNEPIVPDRCSIPKFSDRAQKPTPPVVRSAQGAQGIARPIAKSARDRTFVPSSGRHASAQVGHSSQAQALGDFSKALPAGREEAAEEAPLAQSESNRTSTCRWLSITENPPTATEKI